MADDGLAMPPQPVRDSNPNPNYRVVQTTSTSMSSLMCCTSTRSQKAMTYKEREVRAIPLKEKK